MIESLPLAERPRERCLAFGPETLSLRECIAVVLGSGPKGKGCMGLAADLLDARDHEEIEERFFEQWMNHGPTLLRRAAAGLGPAGQARLLACFEIARRYNQVASKPKSVPRELNLSVLEYKVLQRIPQPLRASAYEWFGFVGIFKNGSTTNLRLMSQGQKRQVQVDKQKLFLEILLTDAPAFILVHNHPSGDLEPSAEDLLLTNTVNHLARQLHLQCLSHLIVTSNDVGSFSPSVED